MKKHLIKKIVITGTHLTPAIELINQLKSDNEVDWQIHYLARLYNSYVDKTPSIESQIIPKLGVKFYSISCGKLDRRWLPNTLRGIPQTLKGFFEAFNLITRIKPDIIVSFGGYVSVPVVISGWFNRIPSITHEQTLTNSLTTKINSYFVNKIALSFDNPKQINDLPKNKAVVTGNLLRSEIFNSNSSNFEKIIGSKNKKPIIYLTAGNQGSHNLNLTLKSILPELQNCIVIHQTGKYEFEEYQNLNKTYFNYFPFAYIGLEDIGWIFNNADIFISRSGANTSQEIVALKKNSILIPLPKSQQNEQQLNAAWVKKQLPNQTIIISPEELDQKILLKNINKLLSLKIEDKKTNEKSIKNLNILHLIHELI